MSNPMKLINDILVDLFKNILDIEEQALKDRGIIDLSMNEMHTLEAIGYEDVKTMSETAEILKITLGTLTTSVNRLVKKGYVQRLQDEKDRRIVLIKLTDKGQEAYKIHEDFHMEMVAKMLIDLNLESAPWVRPPIFACGWTDVISRRWRLRPSMPSTA